MSDLNLQHFYSIPFTAPKDCCDPIASCSCGTHTGHFACVCPAGYYGRGLVGDCKSRLLSIIPYFQFWLLRIKSLSFKINILLFSLSFIIFHVIVISKIRSL